MQHKVSNVINILHSYPGNSPLATEWHSGSKIRGLSMRHKVSNVINIYYRETSALSWYNLVSIDNVITDMKVRTNAIITQFKPVSWKSKVTLFNSQCLPLYGCHLWRLDDINVKKLCTTWRKCCRKLLGLNPRTRSHLIPHIMGTAPIYDIVMYRMFNFIIEGINHQ